jgi:hypothetical protein
MSILETFYILFKGDTSDLKKGTAEAEKSTKKLQETLSATGQASERIGASFVGMARAFTGLIAGAVSAAAILHGLRGATDYSIQLGKISRELGVNTEELDAWGQAVERSGGTVEGFQSSLRSLGEHLGGSPALALKVLPQLADVFERLGRYRALQYGKMLGLDINTILLLQQGRREVESSIRYQKELGVVTQHNADISRRFNQAMTDTNTVFRSLYLELASEILPYLTKFLQLITPGIQYLKQHIELVKGAFIGLAALGAIFIAPFILANAAIIAVTAGIAALIALFAIAYEDIRAFMNGNNSLIGDLLVKWPNLANVAKTAFESIKIAILGIFEPLLKVAELIEKIFGYFGGNKKLSVDIQNGQAALSNADASSFNAPSSIRQFTNSAYSRNQAINLGGVTINTQATDSQGIAAGLGKGLNEHLWQSNSYFDDGVIA